MTEQQKQRIEDIVSRFALELYNQRSWQIEQMNLGVQVPNTTAEHLMKSGEAQEWLLMARAAMGEIEPTDENRGYVREICQSVSEWLFYIPGGSYMYRGPAQEWAEHPFGALWWRALIWCEGDELITISEAAELVGVTVSAVGQRKSLRFFVDPTADGRQGKRLVRRSEVLALDWKPRKKKSKQ